MGRIGLFGGTFNPLHNGHLIIAEHYLRQIALDKCIFIPTNISPFKTEVNKNSLDNEHRLNIIKLGIGDKKSITYDDYEIKSGGISYTYKTIQYFKNIFPNEQLFWLIGGDHIEKFKLWKNYEEILESVILVIVSRHNQIDSNTISLIEEMTKGQYKLLNLPLIDISSTEIRSNISNIEMIKKMLPDKVYDYIIRNKLFQEAI